MDEKRKHIEIKKKTADLFMANNFNAFWYLYHRACTHFNYSPTFVYDQKKQQMNIYDRGIFTLHYLY